MPSPVRIPVAELTTARLRLRPYRPGDAEDLFRAVAESIDDLGPWMEWCGPDYSRASAGASVVQLAANWHRGDAYNFQVRDIATGALLGGCGLNQLDRLHRRANLGYWVRSSVAGRGIAAEAARATARFGVTELGLKRLEIVAAVGNVRSQRAAERAGATREGVLRHRLWIHGVPHDAVMFSLLAGDIREG